MILVSRKVFFQWFHDIKDFSFMRDTRDFYQSLMKSVRFRERERIQLWKDLAEIHRLGSVPVEQFHGS